MAEKDFTNDLWSGSVHPIVFSLRDGFVWASMQDNPQPIRLGAYEQVKDVMRDFLAQSEIGEHLLNRRSASNG